ncbi:Adenosine-5'-phosphosulfate reductase beta subunit [compost metagenome]
MLREPEKGVVSWKIRYRDGRVKEFAFPIRTTPWGSIKSPSDYEKPDLSALGSPLLSHEPTALHIGALPTIQKKA